jgi:hypothetical protein
MHVAVFSKTSEACNEYLKTSSKVFVDGCMNADPKTDGSRTCEGHDSKAHFPFEGMKGPRTW